MRLERSVRGAAAGAVGAAVWAAYLAFILWPSRRRPGRRAVRPAATA
ncbi:MAG: hypothetical protein M3245_06040 [Actinomycetota bacterium]|nr:hypothetical protein [Actinomycetota bacterium]